MATFHFKLLENFLEVQVQNTVWALGLQPLPFFFFFLAYLFHFFWLIIIFFFWTCAEVVKTCGAEVKAWVASVIWWCLAKNQTLEQLYQNNVDPNLVKKWFPSWKCWTSIKRFYKILTQQKTNRTNTTGCSQWLSFLIFPVCLSSKLLAWRVYCSRWSSKKYMALAKEWEDMDCISQTQAGVSSPRTLQAC